MENKQYISTDFFTENGGFFNEKKCLCRLFCIVTLFPSVNIRFSLLKLKFIYDLRQRHTKAAKTINRGMILLLMFCSWKPKMP